RAAAGEQVKSLGAKFVEIDIEAQDAAPTGGYAQEVATDEQSKILAGLAQHIAKSDIVITTAAIPGRPAPILITAAAVESMRAGGIIVDLAASTGGNCELTKPGETIRHGEVTIVGDTDLVSRTPGHASQMYAKNVANFLALVTGEDGALTPNWDDDIVAGACVTRDGEVVNPRVKEALA
ncbi:MAG: NAD(P)(+) transhydrogenase (Re/Si-specific) subunit alpha, partial [Acidimicrobiia bacterium]|nr:NAD(P)(+) transhydrogenase (Re/Si-specific) subunit alpha [Acidimicrobiia bacterium]